VSTQVHRRRVGRRRRSVLARPCNSALMASSNIERLRAGYDAFATTGGWPVEPGLLGPDFELHQDPMLDNARVFRGADAPAALMTLAAEAVAEPGVHAERFIEAPGGEIVVIVRVSGHGRASGIAINREQAHVWRFVGEQAREMTVHGSPAEALRALGLDEWPQE
jgi:ketosteroid isomerase-like protein